jgi:radical SAM protein with 4Fe4S-binding SPASM domain
MLNHPEYELGDIWEMTLQQAAEGDRFVGLHEVLASRVERIDVCRECAFKNYCQGGCPGMALVDNGTLFAQDSICELRKELFEGLFFDVFPKLRSKHALSSSEEIQI